MVVSVYLMLPLKSCFDRKGIAWEKKKDSYSYDAYYHAGHLDDNDYYLSDYKFYGDRTDKDLLAVIEEMGEASFE